MGRKEPADVPRHGRSEVRHDPGGQRTELHVRVVPARDDERRQLEPGARRPHRHDGREDGCQPRAAQLPVEPVVERLEIDVRGIEDRRQQIVRLGGGVAVGDEDVPEARLAGQPGRVEGVLEEDGWLHVRVGDGTRAGPLGRGHDLVRTKRRVGTPGRGVACAISQFWQNRQWNGQPSVAIE
jgi:hypothetical protein